MHDFVVYVRRPKTSTSYGREYENSLADRSPVATRRHDRGGRQLSGLSARHVDVEPIILQGTARYGYKVLTVSLTIFCRARES